MQVRALLTSLAPPDVVDAAAAHARSLADELCRADGREVSASVALLFLTREKEKETDYYLA